MRPERDLRVLLVAAATSTTGGGERHVADLVSLLPARGIEVGLVTPPGGDLSLLAAHAGIPFHHADIGGRFSFLGRSQLRAAIETFQPDIVHAHGSRAAFYARLADPKAADRVLYTLHGIHVDKAGSSMRRRVLLTAERELKPRTAHFITVCEANKRSGARLGILDARRTTTVHNGVGLLDDPPATGVFRKELDLTPGVPLALSVGRYSEPKDHATVLRAWALVHARLPEAVLALVGSGELEEPTRALARELHLGPSLRFVEPRPDLRFVYADADVLCLSSLWEGLPYVVLEAMSYGAAVVSTDVDGIPEAVEDGETGLLVPPATPEALADALVRVLEDRDLAERMGAAGRERIVHEFTVERMIDETVAVYWEMAGRKARG